MKILKIITTSLFTLLFSGIVFAEIEGPEWKLGKKIGYHQDIILTITANIEFIELINLGEVKIHVEANDNGIYEVVSKSPCSNNQFRECNIVETDVYSDVTIDDQSSYIDMTNAQPTPPYSKPNDITPIRIHPNGIREIYQQWEIYNQPGQIHDLATWRRVYDLDIELDMLCTGSQGDWNMDILDVQGFHCTAQEFGQWKHMGSRSMQAHIEIDMQNRSKPLSFYFPISSNKQEVIQEDTPIRGNGLFTLPLSIFHTGLKIDETKTYDMSTKYDGSIEPIHGQCLNDEMVHITGTAVNIEDPQDIITFNQWYSKGLEYMLYQIIQGIEVPLFYQDDIVRINGDIVVDEMKLTAIAYSDEIEITTNPSPLHEGMRGDFMNHFFIIGPDEDSYNTTFGFQIIGGQKFIKQKLLGCGYHSEVSLSTIIPPAPPYIDVMHGVMYEGLTDIEGPKRIYIEP